jgi:hypothetical protein
MQEVLHPQKPLKGETFMKRFLMTITLSCALCGSALAGDIPTGGYTPPPPPPDELRVSPSEIPTGGLAGDIPRDGLAQQAEDAAFAGFLAVVGWLV